MRSGIATSTLCIMLAALPTLAQTPLGTEFTYQGHLEQGGVPVNDTADFLFSLFTDAEGGTQIGVVIGTFNVTVTDGRFTVQLGFGSAAFSGDQRFLEIAVRSPAGSGSYTTLSPRQPITAVPYALYALSSGGPWAADGNDIYGTNTGNVGIGTNTPVAKLDVQSDGEVTLQATTTKLGIAYAVKGLASNAQGWGAGVYGESVGPGGVGVDGLASATSGNSYGVSGTSFSSAGRGVFGSGGQIGVYGLGYPSSGQVFGGYFETPSTAGLGVYGFVGASSGATKAILGECLSPSGHAVYAAGNFAATGTKSFRIDHPDDPENKYLLHYCAESPEVINFYSGTVTLDDAGEAEVALPPYFAKINRDPRYTLTAVGAPMPMLHVAQEINADALRAGGSAGPNEVAPRCQFRIAGGAAAGKVCWRVEAVRNDLWVRQRGAPVEVEKPEGERGTYQHPELYDQPRERGTYHHAAP
jgi:hypothetical protein